MSRFYRPREERSFFIDVPQIQFPTLRRGAGSRRPVLQQPANRWPACLLIWARRGAGVVDRGGLENRCTPFGVPWVRIPPPPPARKREVGSKGRRPTSYLVPLTSIRAEGCQSGRLGTPGERVYLRVPWVRIPPPPPSLGNKRQEVGSRSDGMASSQPAPTAASPAPSAIPAQVARPMSRVSCPVCPVPSPARAASRRSPARCVPSSPGGSCS